MKLASMKRFMFSIGMTAVATGSAWGYDTCFSCQQTVVVEAQPVVRTVTVKTARAARTKETLPGEMFKKTVLGDCSKCPPNFQMPAVVSRPTVVKAPVVVEELVSTSLCSSCP